MPRTTVNGVEVNYLLEGQGIPVAFIHGGTGGIGTTLKSLPSTMKALDLPANLLPTDRFRVLAYERRNTGNSEYVVDTPYTVGDLADDLCALLGHVGMEQAIVIGFSMGGMVALEFALRYSLSVIGLCLVATGPDLGARPGPQARDLFQRIEREGERAVFETLKDQLRRPSPPAVGPEPSPLEQEELRNHEEFLARLATLSDDELFFLWRGELRNREAFRGVDYTPRLAELTMPVCIIHGENDDVVPPERGRALARGIPHAELHLIPGADHGVLAHPRTREVLLDWSSRIGGQ